MIDANHPPVLITGASTGIGAVCAWYLAEHGFEVFAGVRRSADGEKLRVCTACRLSPVLLDVTDAASIRAARDEISARTAERGLAGLVNNAGFALVGPLELLPLDEIRRQLEVNVVGQIAVIQAFLPQLRKSAGRVINMSSIAGRAVAPFFGAYSASKYGLEAVSDALRLELSSWGIEVSLIEPGAVASEIWSRSRHEAEDRLSRIPPDQLKLYSAALDRLREVTTQAERRAIPAIEVARVVARALTARRPKSRYLVGSDARLRALLKNWLSDRFQDGLLRWFFRLPRSGSRMSWQSRRV